jgi:hypothetical protein
LLLLKFYVACAMTASFFKADEEFIHPNNFDLVMSGLFEPKIHMIIAGFEHWITCCLIVWLFESQITTRPCAAFVITA